MNIYWTKRVFLLMSLLSCTWSAAQNSSVTPPSQVTSIAVPCNSAPLNTTETGGRTCKIGLGACSTVMADSVRKVKEHYITKSKFMHEGVDVNPFDVSNLPLLTGTKIPKACDVCNSTDFQKLSSGECGAFVDFKAKDEKTLQVIFGGNGRTLGEAENSTRTGVFLISLRKYVREVAKEIQQGSLRITSQACRPGAADVAALFNKAQSVSDKVTPVVLSSLPNNQIVNFCDQEDNTKVNDSQVVARLCSDVGANKVALKDEMRHLASACALETAQNKLEAAFQYVAICEAQERALAHFKKATLPGSSSSAPIEEYIKKTLGDSCGKSAGNDATACLVTGCDPKTTFENKFRKCYRAGFAKTIKGFVESSDGFGGCEGELTNAQ